MSELEQGERFICWPVLFCLFYLSPCVSVHVGKLKQYCEQNGFRQAAKPCTVISKVQCTGFVDIKWSGGQVSTVRKQTTWRPWTITVTSTNYYNQPLILWENNHTTLVLIWPQSLLTIILYSGTKTWEQNQTGISPDKWSNRFRWNPRLTNMFENITWIQEGTAWHHPERSSEAADSRWATRPGTSGVQTEFIQKKRTCF